MTLDSVWSCLFMIPLCGIVAAPPASADPKPATPSLAGTWTLVAADVRHTDGSVTRDLGAAPKGMMLIDVEGRYQVQIYKAERPRFASPDKTKGTPAELHAAVMGASCHFGTVRVDAARQLLIYRIEGAAFPNWEGTVQERPFVLQGDELRYDGVRRADGGIPITVWRRMK